MTRALHRAVAAAPRKPRYVPAFTVEKLEGTTTKKMARMVPVSGADGQPLKDKNGNFKHHLEFYDAPLELGWLVRFPKGHSIHVATYEELEAGGWTDTEVPLIDKDGEEVGSVPNVVRKAKKEVMAHA